MPGHVTLDGRSYDLRSPQSYRRYPVNQMALKLGQGQSQYRDLTSWDAWVVEDWQEGIGSPAESNGMLYSEAESRVPRQIVLPPLLKMSNNTAVAGNITDVRYTPTAVVDTVTVGPLESQQLATLFTAPARQVTNVWVYARIPASVGVTVEIWGADANGHPTNVALASGTITGVSEDYAFRWYKCAITYTLTAVNHCFVFRPTTAGESFEVACGDTYTNAVSSVVNAYDGVWSGDWTNISVHPLYFTDLYPLSGAVSDVVRFNGQTYLAAGSNLYEWNSTYWVGVGVARSTTITDLEVVGTSLYIGLGNTTNYDTMDTAETYAAASVPGNLFYGGGGYLYRAVNNDLYYYDWDLAAWVGPFACGPDQYKIRGLSEMDGDLYIATDAGLLQLAPGDFVVTVSQWAGDDTANGKDLVTHRGMLYAPAAGQYLQMGGGAMRNIWGERRDELPGFIAGSVASATAMTNWPIIAVDATSADGFGSVWAWQETGWHHLTLLPQGLTPTMVRYIRDDQKLYIGCSNGMVFSVYVNNALLNPFLDPTYEFQPFGWFETDWFAGGIREARKDIESVYLRGQEVGAGRTVDVYWQDDNTTGTIFLVDVDGSYIGETGIEIGEGTTYWLHLGQFTSDREEQRWTLGLDRPDTREIKLGFRLATTSTSDSPKLEAYRLKYQTMVSDWYGWDLPIAVSGTVGNPRILVSGNPDDYSSTEQVSHLDSLVMGRVAPFLFTDIDGSVYEVKVKNASFSPEKVEWVEGALRYYGVYTLQIEQVTQGVYTG